MNFEYTNLEELEEGDLVGQILCYDIYDRDNPEEVEKVLRYIKPGALYLDNMSREKIKMYTDMANKYAKVPVLIVTDVEFGPGENMAGLPVITNAMAWGCLRRSRAHRRSGGINREDLPFARYSLDAFACCGFEFEL